MIMSRGATSRSGSEAFYSGVLIVLNDTKVPFLVGGTCAVNEYIGLGRPTKDLDLFCRPGDFPKLLSACAKAGYEVAVEDERWIGKIQRGEDFCDVVFGSANMVAPVTDAWFLEEHPRTIYGVDVRLLPPTELVWSKVFIMDRYKFDGNDVVHIILRKHEMIDWKRLLSHHDQHWEVLLIHLMRFRYIYPAERAIIPAWVMEELLGRLSLQEQMPLPQLKVCRGRIFSRDDFVIDIREWGMADLVGAAGEFLEKTADEEAPGCAAGPEPLPQVPRRRAAGHGHDPRPRSGKGATGGNKD
jgi:hypothetical protein